MNAQAKAAAAQRLLDDPLFKEVMAGLREETTHSWLHSPARDTQAREIAWLTMKNLDRIEAAFKAHVDNGRIAAQRAEHSRA